MENPLVYGTVINHANSIMDVLRLTMKPTLEAAEHIAMVHTHTAVGVRMSGDMNAIYWVYQHYLTHFYT